jgi:hypothetical protein
MTQADLWLDAREKTRELYQPSLTNLVKMRTVSLPGRAVKQSLASINLGRDKACLAIDLNHWREAQVKRIPEYQDAGVDLFIGRLGGPTRWVYGDWRYAEDKTWRMMLEQCAKIGIEPGQTVGYLVENPFLGEDASYTDDHHAQLCDQYTSGGAMPGAFILDQEVDKCWKNGKDTFCTHINLTRSLSNNMDKIYKKFRRMVGLYTGRWFVDAHTRLNYETLFNNLNGDGSYAGKQRWLWLAWLPVPFKENFAALEEALSKLPNPTSDQLNRFLRIGNSEADLWQFTFTLKLPGDPIGVDASVSLKPWSELAAYLGLTGAVTPPPADPPTEPPAPPTDPDLTARVGALSQELTALTQRFDAALTHLKGAGEV